MYQQVIVIGHVGKDPETRNMPNGNAVTNFSVAASERWRDKASGEQKEHTEWFRCTAYGRLAEVIQEYVAKGSKIMVTGRNRTRSYEKDGETKYATDLIVQEMKLLDSKGGDSQREERPAQRERATQAPAQSQDFDDDIPF